MLKCLAYRFRAAAPTFYASLGIRQKTTSSLKDYLRPVVVKHDSDQNIGNELCGSLMKEDIIWPQDQSGLGGDPAAADRGVRPE